MLSKGIHKNAGRWLFVDFRKLTKLAKMKVIWHCHCDFIMNFLTNSYFILKISHAKAFKMRYAIYQYYIFYPKIIIKIHFHGFLEIEKIEKTVESMKSYFPASLWISLDRIIVHASSIPHFKALGMRNLQYERSIYKKN